MVVTKEVQGLLDARGFADGSMKGIGEEGCGFRGSMGARFLAGLVSNDNGSACMMGNISPNCDRDIVSSGGSGAGDGEGNVGEPSGGNKHRWAGPAQGAEGGLNTYSRAEAA